MSFSWEVTDNCVAIPAYEVIDLSTYDYIDTVRYASFGGIERQFSRQIGNTSFYATFPAVDCRKVKNYIYDFDDNLLDSFSHKIVSVRNMHPYVDIKTSVLVSFFPELVSWSKSERDVYFYYPIFVFIEPNVSSSNPDIAINRREYSRTEGGVTRYYSLNYIGSPVPLSQFLLSIGVYFYNTKISSTGEVTIDIEKSFYRPLVWVVPYYVIEYYRDGVLFWYRQFYQNSLVTEDVSSLDVRLYPMVTEYYPVYESLPQEKRIFGISKVLYYPDSFWMEGTDELV